MYFVTFSFLTKEIQSFKQKLSMCSMPKFSFKIFFYCTFWGHVSYSPSCLLHIAVLDSKIMRTINVLKDILFLICFTLCCEAWTAKVLWHKRSGNGLIAFLYFWSAPLSISQRTCKQMSSLICLFRKLKSYLSIINSTGGCLHQWTNNEDFSNTLNVPKCTQPAQPKTLF